MDILALLRSAESAGLKLTDLGRDLRVRGPKRAESLVRQLQENKRAILIVLKQEASWDSETAELIQWFVDEGQHCLPSKAFRLTPWQGIPDPDRFKQTLLHTLSLKPDKAQLQHGTLIADLLRLKQLFGNEQQEVAE